MAFWGEQLRAGLRFPVPQYLYRISELYGVPLNQFSPNRLSMMISFFMLIKGVGEEPNGDLFFTHHNCKLFNSFFYTTARVKGLCSFLGKPHDSKPNWNNEYFFVIPSGPWDFPHDGWVYANPLMSAPSPCSSSILNR